MPRPIVERETSQYAALVEPHEDRHACPCAACMSHRAMHYGYDQRPVMHLGWRTWLVALILSALIILAGFAVLWSVPGYAREGAIKPIKAPAALTRARAACPATTTIVECRGKLREAYAAVAWQQQARAHDIQRVIEQSRGKQPFAYAAKLAYLACRSFSATPARCSAPAQMLAVGRCESGLQSHDPNPTSTADGWMQFLTGTWSSTAAGHLGYSRYDVLAMGIATAGIVHHDGSWRQWSCGYAA